MAIIRFTLDPSIVMSNIDRMKKHVMPILSQKLYNYQKDIIETALKYRVANISRRDPLRTKKLRPGDGLHILSVINSITTSFARSSSGAFIRTRDTISVGTGDIEYMDRADILHRLINPKRSIKNDTVKLWRILEYGTNPHTIAARNVPRMKFRVWPSGRWIEKTVVNHPGQKGRFFASDPKFLSSIEGKMVVQVKIELAKFIKLFSG